MRTSSHVEQRVIAGRTPASMPRQPLRSKESGSTVPQLLLESMYLRSGHDFSRVQVYDGSRVGEATSVSAALEPPEEEEGNDLPPVETSPGEREAPPGDASAGGGSGAPGAQAGTGGTTPAAPQAGTPGGASAPSSVFFVSFQSAPPPQTPDQSQASPGPGGASANRAGYTRVRVQKRLTIAWDTLPPGSDGRIPLYVRSANIFYRLDPIQLFVSSDYAVGTCPYRVTLQHERSHVSAFTQIFYSARASLLSALGGVSVPTVASPRLVSPGAIDSTQEAIGQSIASVVRTHSANLVALMESDRQMKDAPSAYAAVYAQCPAADW